ncbi:MAG: 50S ribosomal protein L18 [Candidatus Harrisonbacteria bacterium]|nr:50S ribosomal protein L18 [Candidatus Harrisonbacteria bacterium]
MNQAKAKNQKVLRRQTRTRKRVKGSAPRLSVFRSNKIIYAQIIDDSSGKTVASASSKGLKQTGMKAAQEVGTLVGEAAKKVKVENVVFDRGRYSYQGQVKALAEAAREAGLQF